MRRRRRPGVTAAATTAVLATGEGPGLTAFATTAVFATGWPITPTLPTRARLSGMSVSFGVVLVVGFDRGDDRLDRDASVGDELSARAPCRGGERCRPQVLPDEDSGRASRLHGGREVCGVLPGQQLGQLGLDLLEWSEVRDVGELHRLPGVVLALGQDQYVDHADGAGIDERDEL